MSHAGLSTGTAPQQHGQSSRAGWGPRGSQHTQRAPCRRPSGQPWLPDAELPGTCSCSHWGQVTWETPPDRCLSSTTQVLGTSAGRGTPCGPSSAHRAWSSPLQHVSALLSHLLRPPGTHRQGATPPPRPHWESLRSPWRQEVDIIDVPAGDRHRPGSPPPLSGGQEELVTAPALSQGPSSISGLHPCWREGGQAGAGAVDSSPGGPKTESEEHGVRWRRGGSPVEVDEGHSTGDVAVPGPQG